MDPRGFPQHVPNLHGASPVTGPVQDTFSICDGCTSSPAYLVAYRFDDGALHTGPVEISRPFRMSVVRAAMRQTDSAWKIAGMTLTPGFDFVSDTASCEVRQ